jgi:hypothetical protein
MSRHGYLNNSHGGFILNFPMKNKFKFARKIKTPYRPKYSAVIPWAYLSEEYKAKRTHLKRAIRPFIFGSWTTPEEAEAAGEKYLATGEVSYGKAGYGENYVFKVLPNKKRVRVTDPEEIAKLKQARKADRREKVKARRIVHRNTPEYIQRKLDKNQKARDKRAEARRIRDLEKPPVIRSIAAVAALRAPVLTRKPYVEARSLNATQLDEIKESVARVTKYKARAQLFTVRFPQLDALRSIIPDTVSIEIENEKWLYLKSK